MYTRLSLFIPTLIFEHNQTLEAMLNIIFNVILDRMGNSLGNKIISNQNKILYFTILKMFRKFCIEFCTSTKIFYVLFFTKLYVKTFIERMFKFMLKKHFLTF